MPKQNEKLSFLLTLWFSFLSLVLSFLGDTFTGSSYASCSDMLTQPVSKGTTFRRLLVYVVAQSLLPAPTRSTRIHPLLLCMSSPRPVYRSKKAPRRLLSAFGLLLRTVTSSRPSPRSRRPRRRVTPRSRFRLRRCRSLAASNPIVGPVSPTFWKGPGSPC